MADPIDVGSTASNRNAVIGTSSRTVVNFNNAANGTGKITEVKLYSNSTMLNAKVAVFSYSGGTTFVGRNPTSIGTITAGGVRTFSIEMDIDEGEFIGVYATSGGIESDNYGGSGGYYRNGDGTGGSNTYSLLSSYNVSIYGSGETVSVGGGDFMMMF